MTDFKCSKCEKITTQYGKKNMCKQCYMKEFNKVHYLRNRERIRAATRAYYEKNREKINAMKLNIQKDSPSYKAYQREYYENRRDIALKTMKEYYYNNKEAVNKKSYEAKKIRLKTNTEFRIKECLASRMRMAIINHKGLKQSSSIELLGADIATVRKHIESQFKPGMTWENHGQIGWNIDHILPCDSFDLTKVEEQKKCFHYTNLQPLWYDDNIRKAASISKKENNVVQMTL